MFDTVQLLEVQKILLDIQVTSQFASKNIQESFIYDNIVEDLYSLIEKLHLVLALPEKKILPSQESKLIL